MDTSDPFLSPYPRRDAYQRPRRRRRRRRQSTPGWLILALILCVVLVVITLAFKAFRPVDRKGKDVSTFGVTASAAPLPSSSALIEPTAPQVEGDIPLPQEEDVQPSNDPVKMVDSDDWFSDAVFIGDSRVSGLRLYSGITAEATFLDHTGLSIYTIANGKAVLPRGEKKVSVMDALAEENYGKVYISVGVNELGYFDPAGFGKAYEKVLDAIRECQPDAELYVQSLIPVNEGKCKEKGMPYYITNEGVSNYNEALAEVCGEKDVFLLEIPEELVDENGELLEELTTDGVHFKKEGYVRWLDHLTACAQTETVVDGSIIGQDNQ